MRKIIIGLIAFIAVICMFWVYGKFVDTVPMTVSDKPVDDHLVIPQSTDDIQRIGGTQIIYDRVTRFVVLDPDTKVTKQIYGFEELLNPGTDTSRRKVLKPYIIFYEPTYECRVDSDEGTFQIEIAGTSPTPKDAQLNGNVVIHLTPKAGSKLGETSIYMDDLVFSSERSEFATEGPVKIMSKQMVLDGYGLILIFDTEKGRVEYMQIRDLDALHIREFLASGTARESRGSRSQPPASGFLPDNRIAVDKPKSEASGEYYECILADNVLIEYGGDLVVSGAQRVNIQNILFSSESSESLSASESTGQTKQDSNDTAQPKIQTDVAENDTSRDVFVRCDGGIILRPMGDESGQEVSRAGTELSVEMSGTPLRIDRITPDNEGVNEPLVSCGQLEYRPEPDILKLFTDVSHPEIVLEAQQSRSRIETSGNVIWDRKQKYANIAGPGTIYLAGSDLKQEPSEIVFDGMMNLLFAELPHQISEPVLQTINFSGGFSGIFKDNGGYKTQADSARLDFGLDNVLSKAHLLGDVLLESLGPDSFEKVLADSAIFYFKENHVKTAELEGQARFNSEKGRLSSPSIRIEFGLDEAGAAQATNVKTMGSSLLETVAGDSQQPAVFEAHIIDYNLQTGSGVAQGPIRFTFYQDSKQTEASDNSSSPIVVTADKNAEFLADPSRSINQIVFNQNVLVTHRQETSDYQQLDNLHGDVLTVNLNNDTQEQGSISRITMTEGNVFAESIRTRDEKTLFHSKIYSDSLILDQRAKEMVVQGPGKLEIVNNGAESETGDGADFQQSFVTTVNGFKTIRWYLDDLKIVAEEDRNAMEVAYYPLVDGIIEKQIFLYTRHLEADYSADPLMLRHIFTDQGITCEQYNADKSQRLHNITGQSLKYDVDTNQNWLTIRGSESNPCYADGLRTDRAYINLETGDVQTSLSTLPGVIDGF